MFPISLRLRQALLSSGFFVLSNYFCFAALDVWCAAFPHQFSCFLKIKQVDTLQKQAELVYKSPAFERNASLQDWIRETAGTKILLRGFPDRGLLTQRPKTGALFEGGHTVTIPAMKGLQPCLAEPALSPKESRPPEFAFLATLYYAHDRRCSYHELEGSRLAGAGFGATTAAEMR
ncbi:MAG: hypothetical protein LBQ35_01215 [Spirochaetaceae bacterium]|jgi:hypothetical protein|nr:hypothetical protein [Spirochaetaceae bacterium]